MTRLLATLLLILATFGLVVSPVAACHAGMQPAPAEPAAAQSPCHEAAEAPDESAPAKADALACCKAMCAPVLPVVEARVADRLIGGPILHAPRPASLAGLVPAIDKPPPRTRT